MPKRTSDGTPADSGCCIRTCKTDSQEGYLSLTDIACSRSPDPLVTVHNWLRSRDAVEFLGEWEIYHNPAFDPIAFAAVKSEAGRNAYVFSVQRWNEELRGIGLVSKSGRDGGIYAHVDIAYDFALWLSPEFRLHALQDYKRLKRGENRRLSEDWDLKGEIAQLRDHIPMDAIQ